jgi:hypothetical protein
VIASSASDDDDDKNGTQPVEGRPTQANNSAMGKLVRAVPFLGSPCLPNSQFSSFKRNDSRTQAHEKTGKQLTVLGEQLVIFTEISYLTSSLNVRSFLCDGFFPSRGGFCWWQLNMHAASAW